MKKFLATALLLVIVVACSTQTPPVAEDFVVTSLGNYNITLYKNLTAGSYIEFDIISSMKLDNASILIDTETPYTAAITEKEVEDYPYYVFQNYQDVDWNKMYELHIKAIPEDREAVAEFTNYRDKHLNEFEEIFNNPPLQDCFYYTVTVIFQMLESGTDEAFDTITFKFDDREIDIEVGTVTIDYSTQFDSTRRLLSSYNMGAWNKGLTPNPDGYMIVNDAEYMAMEDLYITNIYVLDDDKSVTEVSISIQQNDTTIDKLFSPETKLFVEKGSFIKPRVVVADSGFINQHLYSTFVYVVIEYEVDNQTHYSYFESMFRTRPQMYELYAAQIDDIDFLPFYYQYFSRLQN